jgi:hypothetical protein
MKQTTFQMDSTDNRSTVYSVGYTLDDDYSESSTFVDWSGKIQQLLPQKYEYLDIDLYHKNDLYRVKVYWNGTKYIAIDALGTPLACLMCPYNKYCVLAAFHPTKCEIIIPTSG